MDFYKYKCPVCNKQFKEGDDIVVCPECGTPPQRMLRAGGTLLLSG